MKVSVLNKICKYGFFRFSSACFVSLNTFSNSNIPIKFFDIFRSFSEASEEILQVEQKYNKLRRPYYDKRNAIIQRIPKFWLTAFINHPQITAIIEEDEEDCLQYLNKLEVEEFEDIKSGYRIKLYFEKNPYFDNEFLIKEFHLGSSGDPASQSTPIQWKEGMDLAAKFAQRAAAAQETAKKTRKRAAQQQKTFFTWFCDNGDPSDDEISEVIKDDMW